MSALVPYEVKTHYGGPQKIYRFSNGYGASVVSHAYSYGGDAGLWELGVIKFEDNSDVWHLNYGTPITDSVIGHLTWHEVEELLLKIEALA